MQVFLSKKQEFSLGPSLDTTETLHNKMDVALDKAHAKLIYIQEALHYVIVAAESANTPLASYTTCAIATATENPAATARDAKSFGL